MNNVPQGRAGLFLVICPIVAGAFLWLSLASNAFGQGELGAIVGTVHDGSGAAVPGAAVSVVNALTGQQRSIITNNEGQYTANLLPIGTYTVEAEGRGFRKAVVSGIVLAVNQTARVDVTLEVGAVTESVEITAEVPLVKTDSSDVGTVVNSKEVVELPLNGRKFTQLAALSPGAIPLTKLDAVMGSESNGGGIVANGASTNANQITLDGVENQDFLVPRVGISPNPDAIAEFKIMGATYSAEYGRGAGAHINVAIKSGTNDIHGGFFWFHRNDNLDARNFFDTRALPEFKRNQYGGTFGGPVVRNKTFYFASFEGLRSGRGLTVNATVPTDAQRMGDLSLGRAIFDPLTTARGPDGRPTREPFAGNRIPVSRIAPEPLRAMDLLLPRAQRQIPDQANAVFNPVELNDQDQIIGRVDHHFTVNDTLFGRYAYNRNPRLLPIYLSGGLPGQGTVLNLRQQNAVVGYTKVISPTMVNEARVGYNYFYQELTLEANDRNIVGEIGIEGALQDPAVWGAPNINVTGMTSMGAFQFAPSVPKTHGFAYMDTLAITKNSHNIKIGVDARRARMNGQQFPTGRGVYTFSGGLTRNPISTGSTGQGIGDFLLGYPQNTTVQLGRTDNDIRSLNIGFFFQDDWTVHPNLTLNLGMRYNYMPQPVSAADRIINWSELHQALIFAQNDLDKPTACAGCDGRSLRSLTADFKGIFNFMTRDQVGWHRRLLTNDLNNIEPRVGFAWRMFGNNNTVLRAAWGRFYEVIAGNIQWNYTTNPPLSRNLAFAADVDALPVLTLKRPFPGTGVQGSPGANGTQYQWEDPYQDNWNISVQRRLFANTSLDVAYVGSKGTGIRMGADFNSPVLGTGAVQPRRPHPEHGGISLSVPWGHRWYDSMQVKLETRASDLNILASYTWANLTTLGGGGINESGAGTRFGWNFPNRREPLLGGVLSPDDRYTRIDRGSPTADIQHRMSIAFVWDLPFGRGRRIPLRGPVDWIAGGWQLSGIITFESGTPIPAAYGIDNLNGTGTTRPNQVANPNNTPVRNPPLQWLDRSAFTDPVPIATVLANNLDPLLAAGNAGRATIIGPGTNLWDLGVFKTFHITERWRLQYRAEFFNAWNHANWGNPNTTFLSPAFGQITSTSTLAREIQFGLKVNF